MFTCQFRQWAVTLAPVGARNSPNLLPVSPRLHLRYAEHSSQRSSPPNQDLARLSSEGRHRGRSSRPEPVIPRARTNRSGHHWSVGGALGGLDELIAARDTIEQTQNGDPGSGKRIQRLKDSD